MKKTALVALAAGVATTLALAACTSGGTTSSSSAATGSADWILGTSDTITALDPAGAYDIGSWNLQYSLFQQLVVMPANSATESPDAAASCKYDDPKTLTCKLKANQKFSNGNVMTSKDVLFSMQRNLKINDPNGASTLLASISNGKTTGQDLAEGAITTPDDSTVVFHLNAPDTTFIKVLTTAAGSIVDSKVFPADKLLADASVIGSGPYALAAYKPGEQAVLKKNPNYAGDRMGKANQIYVQFYKDASPLKQAVSAGEVDVAWRTLSPVDLADLKTKAQQDVVEGQGSEFRYWVWGFNSAVGKQAAVRKAAAYLINRDEIATKAYNGNVTASYSVVPPGFAGQKDSFKTVYGATPNLDAAKKALADAGVATPVPLTIGYTPQHYGPNAVDEATQFMNQLNASGLFTAKITSAEWKQYQTLYKEGAYDLWMLGWYPDFLDADNYLAPFLVKGGFFKNGYNNDQVNTWVAAEQAETDAAKRATILGQLQDQAAADVPLIPSWNGKNVAVSSKKVTGVKDTLDPSYIFRMWMVSKSG